jgi:DNA-binding response OmpR family regulator
VTLEGRRFLVVEDEFIIGALLEDYLAEIGCSAGWYADSIGEALRLVETETGIDGAILDMNLNGEAIDPVADALARRQIPFCFMTGYGSAAKAGHPSAPTISKPFSIHGLRDVISQLIVG